eukprot:TRINITY_DN13513_c0_g1_i1.p1 TRINITY_DN13513_c0_g1~~TRINITY_DN13513_c0_g1_i1.p1  ORF type:complete len:308 (-),score=44.97 TRINITY_DN13513_c0_g1_i1:12-935(-)
MMKNSVFFSGGKTEEISKTAKQVFIDFEKKEGALRYHSDMEQARYNHCLVAQTSGVVLALGGVISAEDRAEEITASCEKFNPSQNSWGKVASLNIKREQHAACLLADTTIYVFGGIKSDGLGIEEIEKNNISGSRWEIIHIKTTAESFHGVPGMGAVEISSNSILIFGGSNSNGTDTHLFSISQSELKKVDVRETTIKTRLTISPGNGIVLHQNRVYCGINEKVVLLYSLASAIWNEIQFSQICQSYAYIAVSYTHLTLPTILLVQISVVAVSLKKKKQQTRRTKVVQEMRWLCYRTCHLLTTTPRR